MSENTVIEDSPMIWTGLLPQESHSTPNTGEAIVRPNIKEKVMIPTQ
eukprot:CAMPEP_0202435158 /NCGR_PEP_ID=MMETSP1345-20130828/18131_1 /ASSEMBLY_ACC=CAM_ASM_000843 /TAXON_ID=342563 /ORGANISM="Fabrea Fabrea salina" /LENGTH=46 /DNA_ID= /DNA_START= /DNA_END= /DNA_ORIENTATION=